MKLQRKLGYSLSNTCISTSVLATIQSGTFCPLVCCLKI
jgi:hypothetical protein